VPDPGFLVEAAGVSPATTTLVAMVWWRLDRRLRRIERRLSVD